MKDYIEIDHLTKFDSFRLNRDQVMDLETWFEIHTNVSNFVTASPKTIQTLYFYDFCNILKIGKHIDFHLSYFQIVGG